MALTPTPSPTPTPEAFAAACMADPELQFAVRHWTGGLRFEIGESVLGFTTKDGVLSAQVPDPGETVITVSGAEEHWAGLFEPVPPPFAHISVLTASRTPRLSTEQTSQPLRWQYWPAVERAAELLRGPGASRAEMPTEAGGTGHHDSPVGRYVHLEIDGVDHRIYYEEAGSGIPVLLQHTAGAHGTQWRHLFECSEITDHFRLIAYDLPFHGKSIPPTGRRWWEQTYNLEGSFLRQVPVGLATALQLDQPAFIGCSVGGLLALDLAYHHPDVFRAVISLEGSLHIGGDRESLGGFWHPQVSNNTKARLMESLCAPTSPEPYVKEVSQVYSAGWPPAFIGDLFYYLTEYDLRDKANEIDTSQVAVHILNGEYDYSGHVSGGRAAHEAIAGSTHTEMTGIGHFPMQEHPERFFEYLLPVLDSVKQL